jgi:hypothetical protein
MKVCPGLFVLCCPVEVDTLCVAYPPSRESYQVSNWFILFGTGHKALPIKADDDDDDDDNDADDDDVYERRMWNNIYVVTSIN